MRPLRAFLAIVFLVAGLVLGALNADPATVDLGAFEVRAGLGVILLCTLLVGVLAGGLAIVVSVVLPLRRALRRAGSPAPAAPSSVPPAAADDVEVPVSILSEP